MSFPFLSIPVLLCLLMCRKTGIDRKGQEWTGKDGKGIGKDMGGQGSTEKVMEGQ